MSNTWQTLGAVDPRELAETRMQQHFAAQIVSGVGRTFLPRKDDDSHTNLTWIESLEAFASHSTPRDKPVRAALELSGLRLLLLDGEDQVTSELALAGRTVDQGEEWLANEVAERLGSGARAFTPLHYNLPEHSLGAGAAFSPEPASSAELARWFGNAALILEAVREEHAGSSVRCWPHHFDIATLIELGGERTIGVGLSPGDQSYAEPYWYAAPWPHPKPKTWPRLDEGHWHTEGFVAAIFPGSESVKQAGQRALVIAFLDSAIRASRELLDAA